MASLLRGIKAHTSNVTAIVTVTDDGGSSGRLRSSLGDLPPGEFRNCLAALAEDEAQEVRRILLMLANALRKRGLDLRLVVPDDEHDDRTDLEDEDGDGLTSGQEAIYGTNATNPDTDGDGLNDGFEILTLGTNATNPDTDGDRLEDGEEFNNLGSDPLNNETDGDGLYDGDEVLDYGTDPTDMDTDDDGLTDFKEFSTVCELGSNASNSDTDNDGLNDYQEASIGHVWMNMNGSVDNYSTSPCMDDTDNDGLCEIQTSATLTLTTETFSICKFSSILIFPFTISNVSWKKALCVGIFSFTNMMGIFLKMG